MRVTCRHTLGDLERDAMAAPVKMAVKMAAVVKTNTTDGNKLAQGLAKAASGPHGKFYYKRLTAEVKSPLVGEYGPHGEVRGNAVGGGWRNGPPNTDLPKSADVQGPKFADDAGKILDQAFW